jgi:type I restriction enzyme S subunit
MRSNYKRLGDYIVQKGQPNKELKHTNLLGINNVKYFVKAKTNLNGIDLSKYRIVERNQFAFNRATTRNGDKISIALRDGGTCIVSPSYRIFEVKDANTLDPQYLMMWFRRPEFDRYARFKSHGSAHEFFDYDEMCDVELPIPSIEKQREIVREYNVVNDRISLNERLLQKLEDTAQAIYKQWFVDFEFPISKRYAESIGKPELEGQPYKSSGGVMEYCAESEKSIPKDWALYKLEDLVERVCVGFVGTLHSSYCDEHSGVRLLRTTDLTEQGMSYIDNKFVMPEFHEKNKKSQLKYGDILVARHGSNGMPVIYDRSEEANCLNVIIIKPRQQRLESKVIQQFMKSESSIEQIRGSLRGSVQSVLNTKIVAALTLIYFNEGALSIVDVSPFMEVQKHIERVREEVIHLDKLKALLFTKISKV